jgi:enhancing lycopene biosynthesis protein 2
MARIGLLLSGCGRYDGTEIHEAVLAMLALDRRSADVECLAPGGARLELVDHANGQLVEGEFRSVLAESARLARGRIVPLREARASFLAGLVIPGGQGVVRALMTGSAEPGRRREVDEEVGALIRAFVDQRKPIGAISLAGSLVSTVLGLPLEEDPFSVPPSEIRVDEERGVVWTPGYMTGDSIGEAATGIDLMIDEVLRRASRSALTVLS